MPASSIESIRTVLANYRIRLSSVLACWRTSIVTVQRTAYAEFIGATAPHQHLVSLVVIAVLYAVNRNLMKRLMISLCASFTMTAGVALAQEFTSTQHVAPPDGAGPAACRTEFKFLLVEKVYGGSQQIAAGQPAGASTIWQRRASRGCGP